MAGEAPRDRGLRCDRDEGLRSGITLRVASRRPRLLNAYLTGRSISVLFAVGAESSRRLRCRLAEEALLEARAELERVTRVTNLAQLTASIAHEINQPLAAAVINANGCLRWLAGDDPNLEEARAAAMRIVKDGTRAADIISRIRLLFNKGAPQQELVDVNEAIREMIALLRSETTRYSISVKTQLAADGIDAMKDVNGTRGLAIKSQRAEGEQLLVSVSDTGVRLPPEQDQIFNAFFTTKIQGTGMGLSISRSIVESHGGRLWAAGNSPRGASFQFTLPTNVAPE